LEFLHDIFAPYTTVQIIVIAVGVSLGALLQSASGFGFGLVAVPVMLNAGLPLPEVLVFSFAAQLWQQSASVIASTIGLRIGHRIPKHILRRVAYTLLAVLAVFAMLGI